MPYRGSATYGANTASLAATIPAATQPGDLLVAFVTTTDTSTPSTPAGWTQLDQTTVSTLLDTVYTRVAQAGDAGATLTVALGGTNRATLIVLAWSGVDTATMFDLATPAETTTAATTDHATLPAATLTQACEVLVHGSERGSAATVWTSLGGSWADVTSVFASGAGQTSQGLAAASLAAGSLASQSYFINSTTNKFVGRTLVLAPVQVVTLDPPTDAEAVYVSGTSLQILWTVPSGQLVDLEQDGVIVALNLTGGSHLLTGLTPDTTYHFRLRAIAF